MLNMREWASKLPKNSKCLEYPNLEYFYLVIQGGSTDLNNSFGLPHYVFSEWLYKTIKENTHVSYHIKGKKRTTQIQVWLFTPMVSKTLILVWTILT